MVCKFEKYFVWPRMISEFACQQFDFPVKKTYSSFLADFEEKTMYLVKKAHELGHVHIYICTFFRN